MLSLPSGSISDSAAKIHGLTMETLKEEGAKPLSRDDAEEIPSSSILAFAMQMSYRLVPKYFAPEQTTGANGKLMDDKWYNVAGWDQRLFDSWALG